MPNQKLIPNNLVIFLNPKGLAVNNSPYARGDEKLSCLPDSLVSVVLPPPAKASSSLFISLSVSNSKTLMNWWFTQLAPRERHALLIGTLVLSGMLGYFILWQPLVTAYTQLKNQVSVQQATLLWMQEAAPEIDQWRGPTRPLPVPTNQPALLSSIEKSINAGILSNTSKRIEPKGEQEIQIEFEEVSFTELMRWLGELYNQHQIQVNTISLERQSLPDTVRARLTLFRFQNNDHNEK